MFTLIQCYLAVT